MKIPRIALILYMAMLIPLCAASSADENYKSQQYGTLNEVLAAYGSGLTTADGFTVIKNFKSFAQEKIFNTIMAQKGERLIRIEVISPLNKDEALKFSQMNYETVYRLYGPRQIQYPGAISNETTCPENKKPQESTIEIMGKPIRVLLANASDRYVLGVWDDDLIKQKAAFMIFYDEKNAAYYQIIVFQPFNDPDQKGLLSILAGFVVM